MLLARWKTGTLFSLFVFLMILQRLVVDLEAESISSGVDQPGVVVRAFDASMQSQCLAWKFSSGKRAGVGQRAVRLALDIALLLPLLEIPQGVCIRWLLHPLDHLIFCEEVDIVVLLQGLRHPVDEHLSEPFVRLQPGCVEAQTERSSI